MDSSISFSPRSSLATHLGLTLASVAISASLIGGLLGLFEQRADQAVAATAPSPADSSRRLASSFVDCTWATDRVAIVQESSGGTRFRGMPRLARACRRV